MFSFFTGDPIVREGTGSLAGASINLTPEALTAEKQYDAKKQLDIHNSKFSEFRTREFSRVNVGSKNPSLPKDELEILACIPRGKTVTGEILINNFSLTHAELRECLEMGMAYVVDDLTLIEKIVSCLPELLDNLVMKGLLVEQAKLEATSAPSMS